LTTVNKPALFRQTFELAMSYPAQEISLQKLLGQLQESGNVTTIKHYLELFEGVFLLKTLQKYTGSAVKKKGSSPKIVPLNTALCHAFKSPQSFDSDRNWRGRIFEAAVGAALTRTKGKLYYWREGKYEVDFVLELEGKLYALEVKSGRKRTYRGLEKFIQKYPGSMQTARSASALSRRSGAADFFRCPLQQPCYKKTISRLGLVCVFRILQNPKLLNGFFCNLFIFSKKALQTIDKLFLFCLIIRIIFMC